MVKTDLTGINGVSQSLLHSKSAVKIARQQQAIKLLSAMGSNRRDSLSLSNFANYNNSSAILDAINFGENVSCGYNPDFKDYGVISFDYNGSRQVVPNYAVPKINVNSL